MNGYTKIQTIKSYGNKMLIFNEGTPFPLKFTPNHTCVVLKDNTTRHVLASDIRIGDCVCWDVESALDSSE